MSTAAPSLLRIPSTSRPSRVGRWPDAVPVGGGEVWSDVLEYRVRVAILGRPTPKVMSFGDLAAAEAYSDAHPDDASDVSVLVRQANWFLPDPATGHLVRQRGERLSEWRPEDLPGRWATRQAIEGLIKKAEAGRVGVG